MIRALVVGRKRPGRPIPEAVAEVAQQLEEAGWEVVTSVVKRKRDVRRATRRAVKDERDVVVAVGGDGAVLQVATVLADTTVALGIIPTGTGNLLAGNLKIPTDRDQAVEALLSGRPRRIDMGSVSIGRKKRAFTVACGIGYDAKVMDATDAGAEAALGQAGLPRQCRPAHREHPQREARDHHRRRSRARWRRPRSSSPTSARCCRWSSRAAGSAAMTGCST